jgi:hypothetical protein
VFTFTCHPFPDESGNVLEQGTVALPSDEIVHNVDVDQRHIAQIDADHLARPARLCFQRSEILLFNPAYESDCLACAFNGSFDPQGHLALRREVARVGAWQRADQIPSAAKAWKSQCLALWKCPIASKCPRMGIGRVFRI